MTNEQDFTGLKALGEDIILSERLAERPATPEQRLAQAVLDDAIDVVLDSRPYGRRGRALRAQTERWLASNDVDAPFSFIGVCRALGIDPVWVREQVRFLRSSAAA